MKRIDAHQHFWNYDPVKDAWITDQMQLLKKDFLPPQLLPELQKNQFEGCVTVQADQSEEETMRMVEHARDNHFIKGVVGWTDLESNRIKDTLAAYSRHKIIKGFRHILQGDSKRDRMLNKKFLNGIGCLNQFGFTYDILIFPDQLKYADEMVKRFPDQKFVLDHLGKPYIKFRKKGEWETDIQRLAGNENVFCKISGMVTEADWHSWKTTDFKPYLDTVTEAFGIDRVIFGSDWPVCQVAATYDQVVQIAEDYFAQFTKTEKDKVFGLNAIRFYNL